MAVTLRLMRFGKKGTPYYRIVAIDKRKKRDGAYIEKVGSYDPMVQPTKIELKKDRFEYWTRNGAQLSEALHKMMKHKKNISFVE